MAVSGPSVAINQPGSSHPSLADGPGGFDRNWFMGRWGVAWSTLPMWKDKKDVTITYTPGGPESTTNTTFDDAVTYRKRSAASDSTPSTVRGVDTLSSRANGATFDWKGSSYLFFVHSHWEVLGYGADEENDLEWAVTCIFQVFSKTLFTPAGIDIYLRRSPLASPTKTSADGIKFREVMLRGIVDAVHASGHEDIWKMAREGFEVPGMV